MRAKFRRKPNRLPTHNYRGPALYSLTLVCFQRNAAFNDDELVASCLAVLRSSAARHSAKIHVYCFMPDHLHLLVEAGQTTIIPDFVKDFKQRTGFAFKRTATRLLGRRVTTITFYGQRRRSSS